MSTPSGGASTGAIIAMVGNCNTRTSSATTRVTSRLILEIKAGDRAEAMVATEVLHYLTVVCDLLVGHPGIR